MYARETSLWYNWTVLVRFFLIVYLQHVIENRQSPCSRAKPSPTNVPHQVRLLLLTNMVGHELSLNEH